MCSGGRNELVIDVVLCDKLGLVFWLGNRHGAAARRAAAGDSGQGFRVRFCTGGVRRAILEAGGGSRRSVGVPLPLRIPHQSPP